jgi:hypothetical protein
MLEQEPLVLASLTAGERLDVEGLPLTGGEQIEEGDHGD